jgi:hypothetical protein
MTIKINHSKFFFHALRTSLMFIAGFLSYEILKLLETEWNKTMPNNETIHFAQRKMYHLIIIFMADLTILYLIALMFGVHL